MLTERLLSFVPRAELHPQRVEVAPLLQRLARVPANSPDVPLRTKLDLAPQLPPVLADPEELMAVLLSLAAAARSAMSESGTLTLAAAVEEVALTAGHYPVGLQPGRYIRFSVSNTGTGLGGAEQEAAGLPAARLYDPVPEFELVLARAFADQVGGALVRKGGPVVGSTVVLWVPVDETVGGAEVSALKG
jgi:signal transduction histidine kinase